MALCLLESPHLDMEKVLLRLDELADTVKARMGRDPWQAIPSLRRVLADEEGYGSAPAFEYTKESGLLTSVLETRRGLPITLSILYLEVARRVGIPLYGVSLPGHFLVAAPVGTQRWVLDPSFGGEILTEEGCGMRVQQLSPHVHFRPSMLEPTPARNIALRLLNTQKRLYLANDEVEQAFRVVDLMLTLSPNHPGKLRDRASMLTTLGAYRAALKDIEQCLSLSPNAPDRPALELTAHALRVRAEHLN